MKFKVLIVVCLVILLGVAVFAIKDMPSVGTEKFTADVFVGIDVAYDNITKITNL